MAMVTITGDTVRDASGRPDNRPWKVRATAYQDGGGTGGVITLGEVTVWPVAGVLSFEVEAGTGASVETPDGKRYLVTIPGVDTGLWELIETAVTLPPSTSAEALEAALAAYFTANPPTQADWVASSGSSQILNKPAVIAAGDTQADARAAIGAQVAGSYATAQALATNELCARMTVRPTRARRTLIEALIGSLVTAGVWAKLDGFYMFAAHDVQAAKLNWVGGMQDVTAVNAPVFATNMGFTGDAATNYLDTNVAANELEMYLSEDATLGVYVRSATVGNLWSAISAGPSAYLNPNNGGTPNVVAVRANASSGSAYTVTKAAGSGLFAWTRDAANVYVYQAGASLGATAVGAGSRSSATVRFLHNSASAYSGHQIQAGVIGAGLSAPEHAALNTALVSYLTAIGAN